LDNKQIAIRSPRDALDRNFGMALVPEDRATQGLLLPKSVTNNISLSMLASLEKFGFIQKSKEQKLVSGQIDRLSIKVPNLDTPVNQLSGGNQQKVVLAKLLSTLPKVLMLFDSTRGVDVGTKAEIFRLLRELTTNNTSILFYSTDSDELINMCDRILVIRQGQIQAELDRTVGNLTEENLVRASLGEPLVEPTVTLLSQSQSGPSMDLSASTNAEVAL
jgi:ribose transport system ATP-binding protein